MFEPIKENWRILLLVVVVVAASIALFAPQFAPDAGPDGGGTDARQGMTNLQYGLDLAGGTRIRAPLLGHTATGVDFGEDDPSEIAQRVAAELDGVSSTDVNAYRRDPEANVGDVEVTDANVTGERFRESLAAAGFDPAEVTDDVTQETYDGTESVIEGRINEAGLSGGSVQQVISGSGDRFLLIEVPGESRQDVIDLLSERGTVQIDIYYPDGSDDGAYLREVLTQDDFESVGTPNRDENDRPGVPVNVVNEPGNDAAERLEEAVQEADAAAGGGTGTSWRCGEDYRESSDPCMLLIVDGEVVNSFGMAAGLADSMRQGTFSNDPTFRLNVGGSGDSLAGAQQVSVSLRAGALPAELDIDGQGTSSEISPTQADNFRTYSALTGVLAVFAVAGMVFLRYREPKVALPMTVTALAEVYALLGFAALVSYPIELAVIAGFIAVVGTGVDDLVIIADEVMSEGEVNSRTVFDSRFRRAFWVIGAAAATTILAMSPLMVLSLGDLSGFAIFTILGVVIGVLITRPAYGDILRRLLTVR